MLFNLPTTSIKDVKVQLLGLNRAKIARLFIAGNFSRRFEDARQILKEISEMDFKADYFVTPSAFIEIPWKFSSFSEAVREALIWADKLMKGIEINADHIFVGIDSYSAPSLRRPHVELSVIFSPGFWQK